MKRFVVLSLCLLALLGMVVNAEETVTLTGVAKGFAGDVTVTVTLSGDKIVNVEAVGEKETPGIGTKALEQLPARIVEANSTDVDNIAGATVTCRAILAAVDSALATAPKAKPVKIVEDAKAYLGFGLSNSGRVGPGQDDLGTQVYSINEVFASVLFDEDGRIVSIYLDQLEVSTPNYDGAGMPHLSGFPGQGGYNFDADHDGKVDSTTLDTEAFFLSEVNSFKTKRQRGDSYVMGVGTWASQADTFQKLFVGMTTDEVEEWYEKYTSDRNGRPLKPGSTNEADKAKFDALTAAEKEMLVDVVAGATMSLNDSHGNLVAAIQKAWENSVAIDVDPSAVASHGFGLDIMPRVGPGKDNLGQQVYSINQVFATTLFDEAGKILAMHVDQLEISTPNYDGAGMPHFSGFPGQLGYNLDVDHDGIVDSKTKNTEALFLSEIEGWLTKRERGENYVMGVGTWASQMDKFEDVFAGKTVDQVELWFLKYTSDVNGRPLKATSNNEADKAKFASLSRPEKDMLVDVVAGATMSLNDSHGNIVKAIVDSYETAIPVSF